MVEFGTAVCVSGLIVFLVSMIFMAIFMSRKLHAGYVGPAEINQFMFHFDMVCRTRGWQTSVSLGGGKINVTKDSLVATDFYFTPMGNGQIMIRHGPSAGVLGWVILLVLLFSTVIGSVVVAFVLHYMSRKFAENDVVPLFIRPVPEIIEVRPL